MTVPPISGGAKRLIIAEYGSPRYTQGKLSFTGERSSKLLLSIAQVCASAKKKTAEKKLSRNKRMIGNWFNMN